MHSLDIQMYLSEAAISHTMTSTTGTHYITESDTSHEQGTERTPWTVHRETLPNKLSVTGEPRNATVLSCCGWGAKARRPDSDSLQKAQNPMRQDQKPLLRHSVEPLCWFLLPRCLPFLVVLASVSLTWHIKLVTLCMAKGNCMSLVTSDQHSTCTICDHISIRLKSIL